MATLNLFIERSKLSCIAWLTVNIVCPSSLIITSKGSSVLSRQRELAPWKAVQPALLAIPDGIRASFQVLPGAAALASEEKNKAKKIANIWELITPLK